MNTLKEIQQYIDYLADRVENEQQSAQLQILQGLNDNLQKLIDNKNIKPRPKTKDRMQICKKCNGKGWHEIEAK